MNQNWIDWSGYQRAAYKGLGLTPEQFWNMTPTELISLWRAKFGNPKDSHVSRNELAEMQQRFPD